MVIFSSPEKKEVSINILFVTSVVPAKNPFSTKEKRPALKNTLCYNAVIVKRDKNG